MAAAYCTPVRPTDWSERKPTANWRRARIKNGDRAKLLLIEESVDKALSLTRGPRFDVEVGPREDIEGRRPETRPDVNSAARKSRWVLGEERHSPIRRRRDRTLVGWATKGRTQRFLVELLSLEYADLSRTFLATCRSEEDSLRQAWVRTSESPSASTAATVDEPPGRLQEKLESLLRLGYSVEFEEGMENQFTLDLGLVVREEGEQFLRALAERLSGTNRPDPNLTAEILLCLGRVKDEPSSRARSVILQRALLSPSAKVRDSAAVGLVSLQDPLAAEALEEAISVERIADLRSDMEQALLELRAPPNAVSSEKDKE